MEANNTSIEELEQICAAYKKVYFYFTEVNTLVDKSRQAYQSTVLLFKSSILKPLEASTIYDAYKTLLQSLDLLEKAKRQMTEQSEKLLPYFDAIGGKSITVNFPPDSKSYYFQKGENGNIIVS